MNKIFKSKWSEAKQAWIAVSEIVTSVASHRSTRLTRQIALGDRFPALSLRPICLGLACWAMPFAAMQAAPTPQSHTISNVQVQAIGVSVSGLKWGEGNLPYVGQSLSASYVFHTSFSDDPTDKTAFYWYYADQQPSISELAQALKTAPAVKTSGVVPPRKLAESDVGHVIGLAIQARDGAGLLGNTQSLDTTALTPGGLVLNQVVPTVETPAAAMVGSTARLMAQSNGHNGEPSYASSRPAVAKIDAKTGEITYLAKGSASFTVTYPETTRYAQAVARTAAVDVALATATPLLALPESVTVGETTPNLLSLEGHDGKPIITVEPATAGSWDAGSNVMTWSAWSANPVKITLSLPETERFAAFSSEKQVKVSPLSAVPTLTVPTNAR